MHSIKKGVTQLSCSINIRIMEGILLALTMFNWHWNHVKPQIHVIMFEL